MPEPVYIAIEGPIGVGKTTLARMLQPDLGAEVLLEIFEENPFLSDFYADRERFAFQTQIFFLLSRYRQQRQAQRLAQRQALISDYIFAKDRLFARLNLHGDELETYERLHSALAERVMVPDLVLYLRASPNALMERIAMRDRPYERSMSRDYIVALATAYDQFFATYQDTRLLVVDTDTLNVVRNPADLQDVAGRIALALRDGGPGQAALTPLANGGPALQMPGPAPTSGDAAAGLELYRGVLELQRSVGDLASALLGAQPPSPVALHEALAACESSLQRLAGRRA
ncbi:MAG TPA: deoxynucleoside kinase [Anaerolineae bacterium]|nr:deoxynucleoside kinase [Anaerolineae bacterium]HPL28606.1 deoxynucleoside kinase [Anaerolineae bacterium]